MTAIDHRKSIMQAMEQLPPLHQVAQKLIAMMNDDRSSAQDLDKLICNDQALAARILKLANSSAYGKSRDIFQLSEAIVLLGHTAITNLVWGVSVADVLPDGQNPEFASQAWEHSLDCAALSQTLAELTGYPEPGNAFVAGLLHDIGLLVQNQAVPEVLIQVIASQPTDPLAAERLAMGLNHSQVGMKLLDRWNLPTTLCEAVRFHHKPDRKFKRTNPLVNIVALADQLTTLSGITPYPRQQGADIFRMLHELDIKTVQFEQMFTALKRSRDNARCLLDEVKLSAPQADSLPNCASDKCTSEEATSEEATSEVTPVAVYAVDDRRQAWYSSVLNHLGIPVAPWQSLSSLADPTSGPTKIVIDFHGVAPTERQSLSEIVQHHALAPIVLGDRRHTPVEAHWQAVPHLGTFFNREEVLSTLESTVLLPR